MHDFGFAFSIYFRDKIEIFRQNIFWVCWNGLCPDKGIGSEAAPINAAQIYSLS
jgi:hypothetical protein